MNAEPLTAKTRTGGQALVEALKIHGATPRLLRAGRESISPCSMRFTTRASRIRAHHLPPGRRRGQHGGGLRQADRQARHLLRHARARRHQCLDRRAHRVPGFDADDPVHRPGRPVECSTARRSRKSTSSAMFAPLAKWSAEIRDADRIPEYVARAFQVATSGTAGSRGALAARGRAVAATADAPAARPYQKIEPQASREADPPRRMSMLMRAAGPSSILGGPGWNDACDRRHPQLREALRPAGLHVVPRQGSLRQHAPNYCGDHGDWCGSLAVAAHRRRAIFCSSSARGWAR